MEGIQMKQGVVLFLCLALGSLTFAGDSAELAQLLKKSNATRNIIKPPKGILKFQYLTPAGPYDQLFDWDMYFMGVALSYNRIWKPVVGSVKNFMSFVGQDSNVVGYVPREISPERLWALPHQSKPFLAQAAVLASKQSGDYQWLQPYFPQLKATVQYWETSRRANDGLFIWFDGEESGSDNNPAVLDGLGNLVTEGVDLQVFMYREYLALAFLSEKLGDNDSKIYLQKAEYLKDLVNKEMWSELDGTFYNKNVRTNSFIKVKTWTNFTPLWANMVSKHRAHRMIKEHLLSKDEFWSSHGVRTISLDEKKYAPQDGYWQGPVWVISNYILMHGLMNYGYTAEATELAQKTVDLLIADLKTTGGMNECYNPETGAPTAGGDFVSWNILAAHMIEEVPLNFDPTTF
jgi:putative isomerase